VRVLKLLLERLGADFSHQAGLQATAGPALTMVNDAAFHPSLRQLTPSMLAAAVLLGSRKAAGVTPFWPTALVMLTGTADAEGAPLSAAAEQLAAALAFGARPFFG
jgi:hypothetical protein